MKSTLFKNGMRWLNYWKRLYQQLKGFRWFISTPISNLFRLTANEIIKHIYDSELILDEFVVNDKEFRIPYRTKGAEVRDIKYASQAEKFCSYISYILRYAGTVCV